MVVPESTSDGISFFKVQTAVQEPSNDGRIPTGDHFIRRNRGGGRAVFRQKLDEVESVAAPLLAIGGNSQWRHSFPIFTRGAMPRKSGVRLKTR